MQTLPSEPVLRTTTPTRFKGAALAAVYACGLVVVFPMLAAILIVSVIKLGPWTYIVPLLAGAWAIYFLPLGFGNPYVRRVVRSFCPAPGPDSYTVQVTLNPRLRTGLRAIMEDADDFGQLTLSEQALEFTGDSITLSIPYSSLARVRANNAGGRVWLYGPRVELGVTGLPNVTTIEFAERASAVLPASRAAARRLLALLQSRAASEAPRTARRPSG